MFLMNPHRRDGLPIIHTTDCARSKRAKLTKVAPEVVSTFVALWRLGVPLHQRPVLCENCKPWNLLDLEFDGFTPAQAQHGANAAY